MQESKKMFLLDAYALIFRAYYAFINRPIRNSTGLNTSAIFGFVSTLDEVLRKENPSHIAVAFDPPGPTFRHDMYKEYKANREATPPDIKLSVPYIKSILEAYKIPILEYEGFEADDVIGTVSKIAKNQGFKVYMMTPDKDYGQLVEEGVYMYKPRRSGNESEILGVDEIKKMYTIESPKQVIDFLALCGDSSDNVPGAPGVGEVTAKKLIGKYGTVENMLEHTDELKGKQKENIENNIPQILLSKKLVTIDTEVPVNINPDELQHREPDIKKLGELFKELEFKTLTQRILGEEVPRETGTQTSLFEMHDQGITEESENDFIRFDRKTVEYSLLETEYETDQLLDMLAASDILCFDTETTGLDVIDDELVGLALAIEEKKAWYIPFPNDSESVIKKLDRLKPVFENEKIKKVGHNLKFDMQILRKYGIQVRGDLFDTMVAHYLLHPEGRHKLDKLAETLLNYQMIPIEDLLGPKGKDQQSMRTVSLDKQKDYACEDADITLRLFNKLVPEIRANQLEKVSATIEMPLIQALTSMELAGFSIDTEALKSFEKELASEIEKERKAIYELAGEEFNIASPKQLGLILFEKLKISSNTRMTKTKQYSTSEETLLRLTDTHPVINHILEFRGLTKLQSTYVTALPKLINKSTKKLHTSFNQTIAATGRLSSVNPNLQNIPIREERGREIRKAFIPESSDHILLSADYSQIELRLMAHMSRDNNMIEAFRKGADIHRSTAARIYHVSEEEVSREMRSRAKTANFGIIYGISAFGLAQRLHIPRTEAKELIDNYFHSFPGVKTYMDECIEKAKAQGFVTTLYGRKRYLPDIQSSNSVVRGVAERNAINSPIQGTAADIIKIAMIHIHNRLQSFRTNMILQVHDELVFDVYKPELEEIADIVKKEMETAASLDIPLEVEMGTGQNWLEAH